LSNPATILSGEEGITAAVEILRGSGVVGLPTETVYGLAGNAFDPMAVARIFEAKGRPLSDPLIVHLHEAGWLERVALISSKKQRQLVDQLSVAFWPGPLTLLLPKHPDLPDLVTAGSERVAVRVTAHPLFQEVLRRLGSPLAAPSANRFGRISPTSPKDVQVELGKSISLILDGGDCEHGMESTLVSLEESPERSLINILRPGPITKDDLNQFGHVSVVERLVNSPGSLPGHYAPKKPLYILESDRALIPKEKKTGLLCLTPSFVEKHKECAAVEVLSKSNDLKEAASNFYGALRRLDQSNIDLILAQPVPEIGIGVAIMDRLRRASFGSIHGTGHEFSEMTSR
jgi:L-threonylcarbamoyladenylate synthase